MPGKQGLLNEPLDISEDFFKLENEYFIAGPVLDFDAQKAEGRIQWDYHRWVTDLSFNKAGKHLKKLAERDIFWKDEQTNPAFHFKIYFISPRTFRVSMETTDVPRPAQASLMLAGEPPADGSWAMHEGTDGEVSYKSKYGSITLHQKSFRLNIYDAEGKLLTTTLGAEVLGALHHKTIPLLYTKRTSDYSRSVAASFSLYPDEKIYGCGESFTPLNKHGQKMVLFTTDAQSAATSQMYKPIPFFISSRGHGIFAHTSSPVTMDFGDLFDGSKIIYCGEDKLDLFFFIGAPKEILSEYTAITGRSPLPPLWSFGLWMSRFTYQSQEEVKAVAEKLRSNKVPCDVIHIDAGWFTNGFHCDYQFNQEKFPEPKTMVKGLKDNGFKVSLWQTPYYARQNCVFEDVVTRKIHVKDSNGNVPTEDAVLDFSNPLAQEWYIRKIEPLFNLGIAVIKADFGEAAPIDGYYASGRSGFYEHNLYPLRYTKLLSKITESITDENIIWARSAWAGSQRYPVHWSGDPEVSDTGMACTLRGGLSLGLSGFSFWSHDIGGFFSSPKEELFARWAFFGLLTSHSRVHGFPPREPWEISDNFLHTFRKIVELKYRLMPYVYTQAAIAAKHGWPLLKALFLNYPNDPVTWHIDNQYLFGDDILVAPIFEENKTSRLVYLPAGKWIDYQSNKIYEGMKWHEVTIGDLPGLIFVKYGSIIPHVDLAQSTAFINWGEIRLVVFADEDDKATGNFYFADTRNVAPLETIFSKGQWRLTNDDLPSIFRIKKFDD